MNMDVKLDKIKITKISYKAAGGNASAGSRSATVTIPTSWLNELGINPLNPEIIMTMDGNRIVMMKDPANLTNRIDMMAGDRMKGRPVNADKHELIYRIKRTIINFMHPTNFMPFKTLNINFESDVRDLVQILDDENYRDIAKQIKTLLTTE